MIDLHGRIDLVRCMDCERRSPREELQDELGRLNADWLDLDATEAPDGDADLEAMDFSTFVIPSCSAAAACSSLTSCSSARAFPATGSRRPAAAWMKPTPC